MGNGLTPGPTGDFGDGIRIDTGTTPRTEAPPPGPIGLDAKGGTPKQSQATMADQIVSYPRQRYGQTVGDGECFTLVNRALTNAGARVAADYGHVTPNADYVWGNSVSLGDARPGDVIQFRDYHYTKEVTTRNQDETVTDTEEGERSHHTAIVERVEGNGAITVLEQNVEGSPVRRSQLFFTSRTSSSGNQTTTISVGGTFWFYRPQAR